MDLGYKQYGLNRGIRDGKAGLWYREWAPGAKALALVGEFNDWTPKPEHWAVKNSFGVWELFLPDGPGGKPVVPHRHEREGNMACRRVCAGHGLVLIILFLLNRCKIKCRLEGANGSWIERIPAWVKWATQEWNEIQFNGVHWQPEQIGAPGELHTDKTYTFKYPRPPKPRALRIYECHVGMSSAEPKINRCEEVVLMNM
jgi:1,4-alpha-glucan branching enzyme